MEMKKIYSKVDPKIVMKVIPGHFATSHSHINYYIDLTTLKARQNEAEAAAALLARQYEATTVIDTVVCMEGCEIIGSYLAQKLTEAGVMSVNQHKTMYIITPETNTDGRMMFRDNLIPMVKQRHVLLVFSSITTGETLKRAMEVISYYGGVTVGISALFSAITSASGLRINALFTGQDLPDYRSNSAVNCPECKANKPIDALVNSYGYSQL